MSGSGERTPASASMSAHGGPQRLLRSILPSRLRAGVRRSRAYLAAQRSLLREEWLRPAILRASVRHLAGPKAISYAPDEVLAICVVRNGESYIHSFVEHHLRLGVQHIVFLDNGSTDGTVDAIREHEHVTLLQTDRPYRTYENLMKRYLAERFSRGRWNLCVDVDERFDYPGSERVSLSDLIGYLRTHGYTAVVAQMLDLFPDGSLADLDRFGGDRMTSTHIYYDTSNIRTSDYIWGIPSNDAIRMYWDGIRHSLFRTRLGLTKAPLAFVGSDAELFVDWHHVGNARLADFSAVLLHYPFDSTFRAKVQDAVEYGRYGAAYEKDYRAYWRAFRTDPGSSLRQPTSRRWRGVDALIDEGFLVTSSAYRRWLEAWEPADG